MCLFTHFAAGALAGAATGNVILGAAAGLASHAVLDAIPHYDHPDWRLELAGGLGALALLLALPFGGWAAVAGGLGGMLPDLENLLQKLGRLRRDQFIFPSHTGLVPHGRTLGPRSLGWQVAIFLACFGLLALVAPGTAAAADLPVVPEVQPARIQTVAATAGRTVVRVEVPVLNAPRDWRTVELTDLRWLWPAGDEPLAPAGERFRTPVLNLPVAVPTRGKLVCRVLDVQWWKLPAGAFDEQTLAEAGQPAVFRGVPLGGAAVSVAAGGGLVRSLTVELSHPAEGEGAELLRRAQALSAAGRVVEGNTRLPEGLLNPAVYDALATGARDLAVSRAATKAAVPDVFGRSGHWLRLEIPESGLYRLSGQDLLAQGVATSSIDPGSLRLLRGGGLPLDADPEFPDSLQIDRVSLTEVAVQVLDGQDGEWNLDDELRFYGLATSAWLDRFQAGAGPLEHFDHPYAAAGVYWLTWEAPAALSAWPADPLRIAQDAATAQGVTPRSSYRRRDHLEQQNISERGLVADNWVWNQSITGGSQVNFELATPLADSLLQFVVDIRDNAPEGVSSYYRYEAAAWINDDQAGGGTVSFLHYTQNDSLRVRLVGNCDDPRSEGNILWLQNNSQIDNNRRYPMALDSVDLWYWSELALDAATGPLEIVDWGFQVPAPGTPVDLRLGVPDGQEVLFWDVSDPARPVRLLGSAGTGAVTYGLLRDPDEDRHFAAATAGQLLAPERLSSGAPADLRGQDAQVDYVVIHPSQFSGAARDLAQFRSALLPGVAAPAAISVLVDDIYDNFSGGQKDVLALRNYLRQLYVRGGGRLRYVCLLGNASRDYRNYQDRVPLVDQYDFVPCEIRTAYPSHPKSFPRTWPYATDDALVSFDTPPAGDMDVPDVAIGRLPANTLNEAAGMVQRAIAYAADPADGNWRNRILFSADDCVDEDSYPLPNSGELLHTAQAELLADYYLPETLDLVKLYGVDYDFPPGSVVKPQLRDAINNALGVGTTMFYYVGHGAEDNLAAEQIFQSGDIANLGNGQRLPVFLAFSCDVGVYDNPNRLSMAEQFLTTDGGGAIGSICASQVSYITENNLLSNAYFSNLYPGAQTLAANDLAWSLVLAKGAMSYFSARRNAARYNFFGDPASRLPQPLDQLGLATASLDTLTAGRRLEAVLDPAAQPVLLGAGDTYDLQVEESAYRRGFIYTYEDSVISTDPLRTVRVPRWTTFRKAGSTIFRGSGSLGTGLLTVPFQVPTKVRFGPWARLRLVVSTPDGDHSVVQELPAVRSSTLPSDDVYGPSISLGFEDDRYRVRAGTLLTAALADTNGIAILGTSPGNSILLEFDDSGFMTDVTGAFVFDADSYTRGRIEFPLPGDLALGKHRAAVHASDALGNVGSDTLSFLLVPEGVAAIDDMTLFPNPTGGYCRLIFELSDPMEVRWDIYTVSGRRVRTLRSGADVQPRVLPAGPQIMAWDGRDQQGDEIANGTYLYVLRGQPEDNRERTITRTGKLVIMR